MEPSSTAAEDSAVGSGAGTNVGAGVSLPATPPSPPSAGASTKGSHPATSDTTTAADIDTILMSEPFSASVEEAMKEVLGTSDDAVDDPDFDPVAFINSQFPTEDSLQNVDAFLIKTHRKVVELDQDILGAVRDQALKGEQARQDIVTAKTSIMDLFTKIKDIKGKAAQSEAMVQEICADIRQLDVAKRNLTTTITTLRRLQMLITAVERLQDFAARKQYQDSATLLQATTALFTQFEDYEDVPKIAELHNIASRVKRDLRRQILDDFELLTDASVVEVDDDGLPQADSSLTELRSACAVVDALHPEVRELLVTRFCERIFKRHDSMFGPGDAGDDLSSVERRYGWFRGTLRDFDARFVNVLPAHWKVDHQLCNDFCERTRNAIDSMLSQYDPPDSAPAETLVRQLNKTLVFEKEMVARFEADKKTSEEEQPLYVDEHGNQIDPNSAEGIRRKHRARADTAKAMAAEIQHHKQASSQNVWLSSLGSGAPPVQATRMTPNFEPISKLISSAFDPYMGAYVKYERSTLDAVVNSEVPSAGDPDGIDRAGDVPVFASSLQLFLQIKSSIKRCTKLTTTTTFFHLSREFKTVLGEYAVKLAQSLPTGKPGSGHFVGDTYNLSREQLETVCVVINTCEYCTSTIPQLEDLIRVKIDPAFKKHVEIEDACEPFLDTISTALRVLAHGLACITDSQLTHMVRTKWESCTEAGDQSAYMVETNTVLSDTVPKLRVWLSSDYFRTMCEKFVRAFVPRYQNCLYRCKKVGEAGGRQLRVDSNSMKMILVRLPALGADADDEDAGPSLMYTNYVSREFSKVELCLTCVALPKESLSNSIQALWPEATVDDVLAMMSMKNMKRSEQTEVLNKLGMNAADAKRNRASNRLDKAAAVTTSMMSRVTSGLRK